MAVRCDRNISQTHTCLFLIHQTVQLVVEDRDLDTVRESDRMARELAQKAIRRIQDQK